MDSREGGRGIAVLDLYCDNLRRFKMEDELDWIEQQCLKMTELEKKVERYEKALKDIDHIVDISLYSLPLHRIGEVVSKALLNK